MFPCWPSFLGRTCVLFAVLSLLLQCICAQQVTADGWHNPVLQLGSVDDWLRDAKATIPDLTQQLGNSSLRSGRGINDLKEAIAKKGDARRENGARPNKNRPIRGGNLTANLTEQQQALLSRKADDCLQVLAFMKQGNVIPREFPQFPINKMAQYRETAKQLLGLMGASGNQAVLGALTNHLMSGFTSASDVSYHQNYVSDLLQVLGDAASKGTLTPQELDALQQAMQGNKPVDVRRLADAIDNTLSRTLAIQTLLDWANSTEAPKQKSQILSRLRNRLSEASPADLQQALSSDDLDNKTKVAVIRQITKVILQLNIVGLLNLMQVDDFDLQKVVEEELRSRKPLYKDVRGDLLGIWSLADSPNARVSSYAKYFVANAFKDAPISHCLYWLGQGNGQLESLIWTQLDSRISTASGAEKMAFAKTVLKAWKGKDLTIQNRRDCLMLLGRIKHGESAKEIVELLLTMPREALPAAGKSLKSITGQDFGPKAGDGIAQVTVIARQWREWLKRNEF
jgi:hypothetical protein